MFLSYPQMVRLAGGIPVIVETTVEVRALLLLFVFWTSAIRLEKDRTHETPRGVLMLLNITGSLLFSTAAQIKRLNFVALVLCTAVV